MYTFWVKPDGGDPFEIQAATRDVLLWEKGGRDRSLAAFMKDMRITDVYSMAWTAAKRQKLFDGTLAQFEETCDLDIREDEPLDPTPAAPSTAG